jgi:hypothetical protein
MFLYTPKYRPPAFSALPKDYELVETPQDRAGYNRPDLPTSEHQFGTIAYPEKLSKDDQERYELKYLGQQG